jgi:Anti-sigma factor NepR
MCLTTPEADKSSIRPRNFSASFELAPYKRPRNAKILMKVQRLNPRGSVEQVMKDIKRVGGLNAEIQSRIGHQLRAMYDDVVRQGVPDRFAELIRKLDVPAPDPQLGVTGDQTSQKDRRD